MPEPGSLPSADDLQFQRAEPLTEVPARQECVVCKQLIAGTYFHAAGNVVCPGCAGRIQAAENDPPPGTMGIAILYGAGAAIAGCAIYAAVSLLLHLQIGLVAILVGIMVGKAIRHASRGQGSRPRQILAVALTYLAICFSYVAVVVYGYNEKLTHIAAAQAPRMAVSQFAVRALLVAPAIPFLAVKTLSGVLSLVVIFFGLRQAWTLTGRREIPILGPYQV